MSSQSSSTRPQQPVQPAPPARSSVNPLTLVIAAVSSAAAAYITSKVWESGTLIATAMTPVIVALVREALEKPAQKVTTIAAVPLSATRPRGRATAPTGGVEPTVVQSPDLDPTHAPVTVRRTGGVASRRWVRVGLVTGIVAFVIAAAVYTGAELVSGASSAGGDRASSIFGGTSNRSTKDRPSTTTTTTDTTETTETAPAETTTVTTPEATTPTVTVTTPVPTTTVAPEATTPAPDATATTPAQTTPDATATTPAAP